MRCLSLETTTDVASIAIADESGLIAEHDFAHRMDLSRRLMPNVMALLADCGMEMRQVEAIGVSIGPGSFTGLRIGVVTAKTLAQALGIPIVGVVTLDLLAHQLDFLAGAIICPLIKVRKGEVYYAVYRATGDSLERLSEYEAGPITDVIECALSLAGPSGPPLAHSPTRPLGGDSGSAVPRLLSPVYFLGDALQSSLPTLSDALGERAVPAPDWLCYPKASILARLALERIAAGDADDPLSLLPLYLRKSAPEQRLGK
jgi:tRNA threonylcarbamoyladenosine biosynthesis protein TsaB